MFGATTPANASFLLVLLLALGYAGWSRPCNGDDWSCFIAVGDDVAAYDAVGADDDDTIDKSETHF